MQLLVEGRKLSESLLIYYILNNKEAMVIIFICLIFAHINILSCFMSNRKYIRN